MKSLVILVMVSIRISSSSIINNLGHTRPNCTIPNERPIIGVLTLRYPRPNNQFLGASDVKWLLGSGARVVPIFDGYPRSYYRKIMNSINGVLLPGMMGGENDWKPYHYAFDHIVDIAKEFNEFGIHFPIWFTCMSFQQWIINIAQDDVLYQCGSTDMSLKMDIDPYIIKYPNHTKIFKNYQEIQPNIFKIIQDHNVTPNYHPWCLSEETFLENDNLNENLRIISTNTINDDTIVQTVEHIRYPFYGAHWHPEKTMNEFVVRHGYIGDVVHDRYSVLTGQYFGNFFVNEARKNCHQFPTFMEESTHLIFNYDRFLQFDGSHAHPTYDERYVFPLWANYYKDVHPINYHDKNDY